MRPFSTSLAEYLLYVALSMGRRITRSTSRQPSGDSEALTRTAPTIQERKLIPANERVPRKIS